MASKRNGPTSGAYPDSLGHVRGIKQFGRHLPRIASGDGNPDWEERRSPSPEKLSDIEGERIKERRSAMQKLEGATPRKDIFATPAAPKTPPPQTSRRPVSSIDFSAASDVAGIPGRLRLTKETAIPNTPTSPKKMSSYSWTLWTESQRHLLQAYEYLCHVGEAQQWIEGCLDEELPFGVTEMEEGLRNGVVLAKLARVWEGESLVKRIFEVSYKFSFDE